MSDGWTITEAAEHLHPPIPRRELARRLDASGVVPCGVIRHRPWRPSKVYPITAIMLVHAEWVRDQDPSDQVE